jgi:hypothetical protein
MAKESVPDEIGKAYPPPKEAVQSNASNDSSITNAEARLWQLMVVLSLALLVFVLMSGSKGGAIALGLYLLLAACAGSIGSITGFLFGIPHSTAIASTNSFRPSTNLEQVSDWLTKIIIGVGLVQADEIARRLADTGAFIAKSTPGLGPVLPQIIIIAFAALGFFTCYIWTRLYYSGMQIEADNSIQDRLKAVENRQQTTEAAVSQQGAKTNELANKTHELDKTAALLAKGELGAPQSTADLAKEQLSTAAMGLNQFDEDIQLRIQKFMEEPIVFEADPGADIFADLKLGKRANGRELHVSILTTLSQGLTLHAVVAPVEHPALEGEVIFLMHPTYTMRKISVPAQNGQAALNFFAAEWFTLVAIAENGKTVLSYDLRDLPGAPDWFKGLGERPD